MDDDDELHDDELHDEGETDECEDDFEEQSEDEGDHVSSGFFSLGWLNPKKRWRGE